MRGQIQHFSDLLTAVDLVMAELRLLLPPPLHLSPFCRGLASLVTDLPCAML